MKRKEPQIFEELTMIDNKEAPIVSNHHYKDCYFQEMEERLLISQCIFERCDFIDCKFERSELQDVIFDHCDISNIKFSSSSLYRVKFLNCKMVGSDLSDCFIRDTLLHQNKANMINFTFSKFKIVELMSMTMPQASFNECSYQHFICKDSDIRGGEFLHSKLYGLDFSSNNIEGIQIDVTSIKGLKVNISQAVDIALLLEIEIMDEISN